MKTSARELIGALLAGVLVATASGAQEPKPRVRLQRDASGAATAVLEQPVEAAESPTVLTKITVSESKLPRRPKPLEDESGQTFSLVKGGPVFETAGKKSRVSFGLWHQPNLFAEDARFRNGATHAEFSLFRLKW